MKKFSFQPRSCRNLYVTVVYDRNPRLAGKSVSAYYTFDEKNWDAVIHLKDDDEVHLSDIVHECSHVALEALQAAGVNLRSEGGAEMLAYLTEDIFTEVVRGVQEEIRRTEKCLEY